VKEITNATETVMHVLSKARVNMDVSRMEIITVCELYLVAKEAYLAMKQTNEATIAALKKINEML
jgi:hypothetical protein